MYTPYLDTSHRLESPFKIMGIKPLKGIKKCEKKKVQKKIERIYLKKLSIKTDLTGAN